MKISIFHSQFDLICDKNPIAEFANSAGYIGWCIGSIPLGIAADYFGRKPVMFASYVTILSSSLASAFVTSVSQLIFLRAVGGLFLTGFGMPSFALGSEIVGIKFRSLTVNTLLFLGIAGSLFLALQAYYIREWRKLTITCSAPYLFFIILVW